MVLLLEPGTSGVRRNKIGIEIIYFFVFLRWRTGEIAWVKRRIFSSKYSLEEKNWHLPFNCILGWTLWIAFMTPKQ